MEQQNDKPRISAASRILPDGRLVELVYSAERKKTMFAIGGSTAATLVDDLELGNEHLVPIPASNSLIKNNALVLPERPEPYGDLGLLVDEITAYFDRYVALSPWFRRFAAYYAIFTWLYDAFEELPYARVQSEFGTGKTRALIVIGSLCYRAFLASGASTVSPIFHTLDTFRGTLVLDEADFRFSDQTAELVKVFNNGHVRGFPVFRTAITLKREFDPRAFHVYGPKLIAMRRSFDDEALESRFITERLDGIRLPPEIPINLPPEQQIEAQRLRNKLLQYRFDTRLGLRANPSLVDPALSPRTNQILVPLLSVVSDEQARSEIRRALCIHEEGLASARASGTVAQVVGALQQLVSEGKGPVRVSEVVSLLSERGSFDQGRPLSARYVGSVLRTKLSLPTYKTNGTHVVVVSPERIGQLALRYGVRTEKN